MLRHLLTLLARLPYGGGPPRCRGGGPHQRRRNPIFTGDKKMENMAVAEELVREFLLFRGFRTTLQAFEAELATDLGRGFDPEKLMELVFSAYIPGFDAGKLLALIRYLWHCLSSPSDHDLLPALSKLEASVLKWYIVHSIKAGRKDKVVEFFEAFGNDLLQTGDEWTPWFAVPYLKNPAMDPRFMVYFSKEWLDALLLSFRNFLSGVFNDNYILYQFQFL